ncbi:MAG TPA: hypothetical protein VK524_10385 [Polyangiaceae bacterium]|nr:hypothetical protein [Polyangiaceae bacterium]
MKSHDVQRSTPERQLPGGRIKGVALGEFARWCGAKHRARFEAALRRLPAHLVAQLDVQNPTLGLIATDWYSTDLIHAFFDALLHGLSAEQRLEFFREGTRAFTRQTMNGVHKGLAQILGTPERYALHAQRIWSTYYDSGVYTIESLGPTAALCTVERWRAHHPSTCLYTWGAIGAVYESMGLSGVEVDRQSCVSEGASACAFEVHWER